jgi:hypothetical protein
VRAGLKAFRDEQIGGGKAKIGGCSALRCLQTEAPGPRDARSIRAGCGGAADLQSNVRILLISVFV